MAREFSVVVGINATRAVAGGRQFKAGADQVNRSNRTMQASTARTTRRMTAMITTMGRFRGVASLMFAGFLGVGGISSVVRTLATFQTSISAVTALVSAQNPRSLSASMAVLTERAREMGATTLFTASQAAEGMKFLTLAGFEVAEVYQAIAPALDLAAAGMIGLGQSADILSNIMAAFSVDASRAVDVADALAFTSARTNTNILQLGEAMKFVGPVAGALGVNVEETAVALGILGNSGLQASLAGTSLRRVMSGLLNPSKEATKIFESMGVTQDELVRTLKGPQGLVNLVKLLADKGIDAAKAFTLFGQRGAPGLLSLVNQKDKLALLTKELDNAAGTARRMARIMADNLGGDARIAISSLQEAILQLGDSGLGDWLRESVQGFTGFIRGITGVVTPLEDMTDSIQKGLDRAEFFMKHIDLLKKAVLGLAIVLARNLIPNLLRSISLMGVWATTTLPGLVRSLFTATTATRALGLSLFFLKGVLVSLGVGVLLVVLGQIAEWIFGMGDAEDAAIDLAAAVKTLGNEAEAAAVRFDGLGKAGRDHEELMQRSRLGEAADQLQTLTNQLKEAEAAQIGLADAQARVATAEAKVEAARVAADGNFGKRNEATRQWTIASSELRREREKLQEIEALGGENLSKLRADVESASEAYRVQAQLLADMITVRQGNANSIEELRKAREKEIEQLEKAEELHQRAFGLSIEEKKELVKLIDKYDKYGKTLQDLEKDLEAILKAEEANLEALKQDGVATERLVAAKENLIWQLNKQRVALTPLQKAQKTFREETEDLRDAVTELSEELPGLAVLQRNLAREVAAANLLLQAGTIELDEYIERVKLLGQIFTEEIGELCPAVKKARECTEDGVNRMDEVWKQGMRNIQDSFAEAFRNMFDSSSSFFDGILDAFKDMIANMLAAWAISGIANMFNGQSFSANGNGFGQILSNGVSSLANQAMGGSSAGGSAGSSGGGGVFSSTGAIGSQIYGEGTMLGDAFASFTAGTVAFFQGAGALVGIGESAGALGIANTGIAGFGTSGSSIAAAGGSGAAIAGNLTAGAAIGIITGYIADQLLGSRGDPTRNMIFSAIGGAIGAYYGGAIGAIIGGAIGSLVDNIFGGAKKLESATVALSIAGTEFSATQTEVVSTQRSFFRGKKYKTTERNVGYKFNALEKQFVDFANALDDVAEHFGGSSDGFLDNFSAMLTLNIKRMKPDEIQAALQRFMNTTMLRAIQVWLNDVEGLDSDIHMVLSSLSGNIEVFARAIQSLMTITALFEIDLVEEAAKAIAEGSIGVIESYSRQIAAYREVIAAHDGSIESLELLTDASVIFAAVQLELIAVYQQIGDQISGMFQGSAQTIREAMMSEEELYALRRTQIDELVEQASMTTDPEELNRLAQEINRLGLDAFSMLDESQIAELGPEFIEFFEGLDELFGGQITEGINSVVQDQADLDLEVATRMEEAAQAIIDAAAALQREADRRERERERDRDEHHR